MRIYFEEGDEDKVSGGLYSIEVQPLVVKVDNLNCTNYSTIAPLSLIGEVSSYLKPKLSTNDRDVFLLIGFLIEKSSSTFNTTVHASPTNIRFSDLSDPLFLGGKAQTYRQDLVHSNYTLHKKPYGMGVLLTKDNNNIHFLNPFEVFNADGTLKNFLFRNDYTPYLLKQTKNAKVVNRSIASLTVSN